MKIIAESGKISNVKDELIVIYCTEFEKKKSPFHASKSPLGKLLSEALDDSTFKGEAKKSFAVYTFGKIPAKRVMLIGLGKEKDVNLETIRKGSSLAINAAKGNKLKSLTVELPNVNIPIREVTSAVVEGLTLTNYSFDKYKD